MADEASPTPTDPAPNEATPPSAAPDASPDGAAATADGPASEERPRLSLRARITGMIVMTVLFLLALEGLAQVYQRALRGADANFLSASKRLYEPHIFRGYSLEPGVEAHGPGLDGGESRIDIEINELGFRGPDFKVKKPEGTLRVFCLGGSTTFGPFAASDAHTWPRKLEAKLRELHPDRTIEVVNGGVQGYTTLHTLSNLQFRILEYDPDLVIVYHATNDIRWASRIGARADPSELHRVWKRHRGLDEVLEESMLVMTIRTWQAEKAMRAPVPDRVRRNLRDDIGEESERGLRMFRRNLEAMTDACRRAGVPIILSSFAGPFAEGRPDPDLERRVLKSSVGWMLSYEGLWRATERYNAIVREVAAAEDATLATPAEELTGRTELFVDHCHFSEAGADEMARVMADAVGRSGALAND